MVSGSLRVQRFEATLRHRERVVREVDLLFFLAPFIEREVDDPGEGEFVLVDEVQFLAHQRAGITGEAVEFLRTASDEEAGITHIETHLLADRIGAFRSDVFGNWTSTTLLAFAPEDITESGLALRLRPAIHAVTECA